MATILDITGELNGVVVSARELADVLNRNGRDVRIVTPYDSSKTRLVYKLMIWLGQSFRKTKLSWITIVILMIKFSLLFQETHKHKRGVMVFHAHDVISASVFLLFSRQTTHKVMLHTHFHQMPWKEFSEARYVKPGSLSYRFLRYFSLFILRQSRVQLIHVSEENRLEVNQYLPQSKRTGKILYPGIDLLESLEGVKLESPYLINVGKIDSRKNQILLIDILAELKKHRIELPFILAGPEDETEKNRLIQRSLAKGVADQIHYYGQQDRSQISILVRNASLYIHTSLAESFGRTIIEAIQLKTPVLALDYPALHEILDPKAMWNPESTPTEIAKTIMPFIVEKDLRVQLQKEQYTHFSDHFTTDAMLKSYNSIIKTSEI
ncbi:MAG: glycosyltransferase family 4 protein [FCB group bacterium]|nr:glycosyltransferase family 4 protein [FCB group bacterium]